jgi:hypothetical protein
MGSLTEAKTGFHSGVNAHIAASGQTRVVQRMTDPTTGELGPEEPATNAPAMKQALTNSDPANQPDETEPEGP